MARNYAASDRENRRKGAIRKPARRRVLLAPSWYDVRFHRGIARYALGVNWDLTSIVPHRQGVLPDTWNGDGLIVLGYDHVSALRRLVDSSGVPTVDLIRTRNPSVVQVGQDNAAIGQMGAEHFLARGFERIGYLRITDRPVHNTRMAGLRETVEAAGRQFTPLDWAGLAPAQRKCQSFEQWLRKSLRDLKTPVAIMCQYDDQAVELLRHCREMGICVPEQIAVLGVDNYELTCQLSDPPLSSVDTDFEAHGYQAAAMLERVMDGGPVPPPTLVPPKELWIRKSTDILAINHVEAARALSFIWEHFRNTITVRDVAENAKMSRRSLHDAFVKHVGRSMHQEITRMRMDYAKELLRDTDEKVHAIATVAGFPSRNRMHALFMRDVRMTPRAYRLQHRNGHE